MGSGIWVIADHTGATLDSTTTELLSKAAELGATLGQSVSAVWLGADAAAGQSLAGTYGAYGVDKVYAAAHADLASYRAETYGAVVAQLVQANAPAVVLFAATSQGRDIAAFVAARLKVGILPDANAIIVAGGSIKVTRPIFGGNALATLAPSGGTALVTVLPKAFEKTAGNTGKTATVETVNVDPTTLAARTQVKAFAEDVASGKINLNDAEVVVAGGRGVGGADKFGVIEDLARALGAAVGASRAVTDAGWRPASEQIGQTGVTLKPKLYIAAGISGAVQHWVGIKESGYIVAINTDADAPIMKLADLAIVGDLFKVIPEMVKAINAAKGVAV